MNTTECNDDDESDDIGCIPESIKMRKKTSRAQRLRRHQRHCFACLHGWVGETREVHTRRDHACASRLLVQTILFTRIIYNVRVAPVRIPRFLSHHHRGRRVAPFTVIPKRFFKRSLLPPELAPPTVSTAAKRAHPEKTRRSGGSVGGDQRCIHYLYE